MPLVRSRLWRQNLDPRDPDYMDPPESEDADDDPPEPDVPIFDDPEDRPCRD